MMATTDRELLEGQIAAVVNLVSHDEAWSIAADLLDGPLAPYLALATESRSEQAALSGWKGDRQGLFAWEVVNDARKAAVAALPSLEGE